LGKFLNAKWEFSSIRKRITGRPYVLDTDLSGVQHMAPTTLESKSEAELQQIGISEEIQKANTPQSDNPNLLVQVINLTRRPDRLAHISSELQRVGVQFETQIAVDGQLGGFESQFLSNGEVGCWKSHVNSMLRLVDTKIPFGLILEDDATLSPKVNNRLLSEMTELMASNQLDLLQIGFIEHFYSISLRPGILEFFIALLKNRGTKDSSGNRFVLGEFRAGAHAYIVNAKLAEAISSTVSAPPLMPWDGYISSLAQGQVGRGDIRIARLVNSLFSQASRESKYQATDSDLGT
jgi:GR25 family glycosyltransferase involved in LPS biosynthesis